LLKSNQGKNTGKFDSFQMMYNGFEFNSTNIRVFQIEILRTFMLHRNDYVDTLWNELIFTRNDLFLTVQHDLERLLGSHNDIVDWYMDEFYKEADEAHDCKPYCRRHGNLLKLFAVWFSATFDKTDRVFRELLRGIDILHYLIHGRLIDQGR